MKKISLPLKIDIKESKENKNETIITIGPCHPGYGTTLGNALRRVLLSSLDGAAVVAVKIKGAHHEFSSIPFVKEDMVDIILNLKQLRVKTSSEELTTISLKAKGEKVVKAKDIEKSAAVEIINPELKIATLTDKKANLEMKLWVKAGRGYVPAEEHGKMDLEIDAITLDSIFSPITKVSINVENTRVGERTDYDNLILNIETDGSITPEEAIKKAAGILIEQFSFILNPEEKEKNSPEEINIVSEEKNNEEFNKIIPVIERKKEDKKKKGKPKKNKK